MATYTVIDFAQRLNCERDDAYSLLRFLCAKRLAEKKPGVKSEEGKKGKPADLYDIPNGVLALIDQLVTIRQG